jgi:ATP-dependent DNA helicase RecG
MITLKTPLGQVNGIGPRFLTRLHKLKLLTVGDLLYHFPTRYEDWSEIVPIADLKPGDMKTIQAAVQKIKMSRAWRKRMFVIEALLGDASGTIPAVWFNQTYIKNTLKPGVIANFSGKATIRKNKLYLSNPAYEVVSRNGGEVSYDTNDIIHTDTKHTGRLVPIYPETRGLTSRGLRYLIQPLLEALEPLPEFLPEEVLKEYNFPEINKALRSIHFPTKLDDSRRARNRFAFEELFLLQLRVLREKLALAKEKAYPIKTNNELVKTLINKLPFKLTASQEKTLDEILRDIRRDQPMNRLLQGDVGSGKTIVAGIAAYLTAEEGCQVAFMAPTEILARQHYATLKKFFPEFSRGLGLLTSKEARVYHGDGLEEEIKKSTLIKESIAGKIKIVIGTHALIQKNVRFSDLALVIIDEQHRFGVRQRQALARVSPHMSAAGQRKSAPVPHFLSMSATPIPRTLMMTVFGDLDLSLITELPGGRKNILTKIVAPENRDKAYAFIRGQVRKGRQGFVICPRIEPQINADEAQISTDIGANQRSHLRKSALLWETKAVKEEYEKLKNKVFPDLRVGMIHGKMKSAEKNEIMAAFSRGDIDLIVSTSVVEVGVDVPNATIMMIEDADRFGLAQIYQFRGRVGRGEHQSFCFLFTESQSAETKKRLESILTAKNGFELAEKDLTIRGPGEFLGEEQSGMPDIAMKALQNPEIVQAARQAAEKCLEKNSDLESYPILRERLNEFREEIHLE